MGAVVAAGEIVALLRNEIREAVAIHASLEAVNDIAFTETFWHGDDRVLNVVQFACMQQLALTVAKIMEIPPSHRKDVASVPVLMAHINDRETRRQIISLTAGWPGGAQNRFAAARSLRRAQHAFKRLNGDQETGRARATLQTLRNLDLAHLLNKPTPTPPLIKELFELIEIALEIIDSADHAIRGFDPDLQDDRRDWMDAANRFWRSVLVSDAASQADGQKQV